jgi:hypothetical protein
MFFYAGKLPKSEQMDLMASDGIMLKYIFVQMEANAMREYYSRLVEQMEGMPVINTHSHFIDPAKLKPYGLDELLTQSYVSWHEKTPARSSCAQHEYLDKVRNNSYFVWLEKSLKRIYNLDAGLTEDNWDELSIKIKETHEVANYSIEFLKNQCNYKHIIHDPHWDPQQANAFPFFLHLHTGLTCSFMVGEAVLATTAVIMRSSFLVRTFVTLRNMWG